jgi:hypothetical protein
MATGPAGYSGTPLPAKLGFKAGTILALDGAPRGFEALLEPLPPGARIRRKTTGPCEVLLVFVRTLEDLAAAMVRYTPRRDLHYLWVAWPKKTSPLAGPLGENDVRDAGLACAWVDSKVCAIDADWSGLRFTPRRARPQEDVR